MQIVEYALQSERNRVGRVLRRRDLVHGLGCERGVSQEPDSPVENNGGPHFSELVGQEERLKQRVHVARRALVFEPDVTGLLLRVVAAQGDEPHQFCRGASKAGERIVLVEVMPQHARLVFEHSHKRRDDGLVVLDDRFRPTFRDREEFAQFDKPRKAPILLLIRETVVRLCVFAVAKKV